MPRVFIFYILDGIRPVQVNHSLGGGGMKERRFKDTVLVYFRVAILLSVAINIGTILYAFLSGRMDAHSMDAFDLSTRLELLLLSCVVFAFTFMTGYIEKKGNVDIPDGLEVFIVIFIFASLSLSSQYNLYYRFHWWDDLLHSLSGFMTTSIAFLMIFKLNIRHALRFNPLLVSLFTFSFALAIAVLWEILEFTADVVFGTSHQHWDDTVESILIGKPYQGVGLCDTMSDLIVTAGGALVMSVVFYFLYKNNKPYISGIVSDVVKEKVDVH